MHDLSCVKQLLNAYVPQDRARRVPRTKGPPRAGGEVRI